MTTYRSCIILIIATVTILEIPQVVRHATSNFQPELMLVSWDSSRSTYPLLNVTFCLGRIKVEVFEESPSFARDYENHQ